MIPTKTTFKAGLALLGFALAFALVGDAFAQNIRVRCEVRADRSRASVDANELEPLNGDFLALLRSGDNVAVSDVQTALGDQVEFDFSSNRNDIIAGAKRIAPDFIQGNPARVDAAIVDMNTNRIVIAARVRCRDRR